MRMKLKKDGVTGWEDGWWCAEFQCPGCGWVSFERTKKCFSTKKAPHPKCGCDRKFATSEFGVKV